MKSKLRSLALSIWFSLFILVGWILWTPIPFSGLKILLIVSLLFLLGLPVWLFKHQRTVALSTALICVLALLAISFWPVRSYSKQQLQASYVVSLRNYLNTKYVWGGENGRGIDCSGLIRRSMIDALINRGWQEKNPALWRNAAQIWWRDCAARDMQSASDPRFQLQFETAGLNRLDYARLNLGDLAVMRSGVHVLAYVGDKTWIQADPNLANGGDKVILTKVPSENGWCAQKMVVCRWVLLNS